MKKIIKYDANGPGYHQYETDPEWEKGFQDAYNKCLAEGDGIQFPICPKDGLYSRGWREGVISGSSEVRMRADNV